MNKTALKVLTTATLAIFMMSMLASVHFATAQPSYSDYINIVNPGPASYASRWTAGPDTADQGTNNFNFTTTDTSAGDTFFVNITVGPDVSNLFGLGFGLVYDNATLQYVNAWLPADNVFAGAVAAGASLITPSLEIAPFGTEQEIQWGASYTQPSPTWTFNGTGTLAQVEFQIIAEVNSTNTQVSSSFTFDPAWTDLYFFPSGSEVPTLNTGNFVYAWAPARSLTVVVTSPTSAAVGSTVNCTATVTGSNPRGTVTWTTSSSTGSFGSYVGTLSSGSCSTTYVDNDTGYVTITASYSGDAYNSPSSGSAVLTIFMNITSGTNVTVTPTNDLGLTFANVTAAGYTIANATPTVNAPTLNNTVGQCYVINVTASFSGNVTVSLAFDGSNMTEEQKENLTMMQYTPIPGDVVAPFGQVDMSDIITILYAFGSTPGKPNWNPACNLEGNGKIDMGDVVIALLNFGKTANWINITTYVDTTNNIIYGNTTHFSFIAIH